jgi:hypothetical protein
VKEVKEKVTAFIAHADFVIPTQTASLPLSEMRRGNGMFSSKESSPGVHISRQPSSRK